MQPGTDFVLQFGFAPNEHELRLFRGRDPIDDSLPYEPAKYAGQTLRQYHQAWQKRGRGDSRPIQPLSCVSIAILCHNYGRFLDECLDSVAAQAGVVLHEVFIVDDGSTDNTAEVCRRRGMRRIRVDVLNVHAARRTAYEAATGDVICFLDADDCLSPNYVAEGCKLLASDPSIGVVYSDLEHFGDSTGRTNFRDRPDELWLDNLIHAGSLVRRDALRTSGAFDAASPTSSHADWTIWKRVVRHGWRAVKQPSLYRYRRHSQSMLSATPPQSYFDRADLGREPITVFVPLSGRAELWPRFAAQLELLRWPDEQLSVMLLDTSQDPTFSTMITHWIAGHRFTPAARAFADVRHVRQSVGPPRLAQADRRNAPQTVTAVRSAVAAIYNWLRRNLATEYVLILEDDNFPDSHTIVEDLLRGFDSNVVSVAAPYRAAYGSNFAVWREYLATGGVSCYEQRGTGRQEVPGNGFGCVMLRRLAIAEHHFTDARHVPSGVIEPDFDIDFYQRLHRLHPDWKCLVDWSLLCDHVSRA